MIQAGEPTRRPASGLTDPEPVERRSVDEGVEAGRLEEGPGEDTVIFAPPPPPPFPRVFPGL